MTTKVIMVSPRPRGTSGNAVTAARWSRILRDLGHRVRLLDAYDGSDAEILVALHARKSAGSVRRFHALFPDRHIVVGLSGTDLYGGLRHDPHSLRSLDLASRIVLLQPLGIEEIPRRHREKTVVIYQSADGVPPRSTRASARFDVAVLAHLRPVKDPFRAAMAARLLPPESRVRILHAGEAMTEGMARRARTEGQRNPRFSWLGEISRASARRLLRRSRLLVLSSRSEGGANAISEAVAAGVPILASRIPGSVGLLGAGYPGFFEVGDTHGLAKLLRRAETDPGFYADLALRTRRLAALVRPSREREAWRRLLGGLERRQAVPSTAGSERTNASSSLRLATARATDVSAAP